MIATLTNPKLSNGCVYSNSQIYKYYAGYSDAFVVSQLERHDCIRKKDLILDPWNGSGTTTLVASIFGCKSYGFDLNPVMIIVAKAKLYSPSSIEINTLASIIDEAKKIKLAISKNDPLLLWYDLRTVRSIRKLEFAARAICGSSNNAYMKFFMNIDCVTPKLAFYYVALFGLLREHTRHFATSNPTWIKFAHDDADRIQLNFDQLAKEYLNELRVISEMLERSIDFTKPIIQTGDSRRIIQLSEQSVDCIITSPPYCTRIDYAIYTRVELALIGYSKEEFSSIRYGMIGTPTIKKEIDCSLAHTHYPWNDIILKIKAHNSKAASSYYYKTYLQYFLDMEHSLNEIKRVLKPGATITMVLQDSWFKDLHIDVPHIICTSLEARKFKLISLKSEKVANNMRYINSKSKVYGTNPNHEVVVIMQKKG